MGEKALMAVSKRKNPKRLPVWFLRQAGRYLPEYREIRKDINFLDLCKNPKLAAEVSLQPLRRYDLDAAIVFSDILIPCVCLGQNLTFAKDHGPQLSKTVSSFSTLEELSWQNTKQSWDFVGETIGIIKSQLSSHQTMIGFAGAPFTVSTYMIEGSGSKTYEKTKRLMFNDSECFKELITRIANETKSYLKMQIKAGADVVMLFDTWAHQLTALDYKNYVLPATQDLLHEINKIAPVIYFPGQGQERLWDLKSLNKDIIIATDWRISLEKAQSILSRQDKERRTLQGNLEPSVLLGPEQIIRERVRMVLRDASKACGHDYVFNLGHGLIPQTPPEALKWVIDEVRQFESSNGSNFS